MSAILATASFAQAASIHYVGTQFDIEDDADTPTEGWHNATPFKPLDIDGDHVLGTVGWRLRNSNSNPSYATITNIAPNNNSVGSWGAWDNPASPSGSDTIAAGMFHDANANTGVTSAPLLRLAIRGPLPAGETLRVGILFDVIGGPNTATYTLTQTVGGTATVTASIAGTTLDRLFVDVEVMQN